VSAKKPNISQIDKYLKGELDARAMHQLERQAQDDPFLMDALEGYENAGKNQQKNLADLKEQLTKRTAPAKQRSLILWRVLPIAATVLLMLGAGYWFFKSSPAKKQYANVIAENKKQSPVNHPLKETIVKQKDIIANTDKNIQYKPDGNIKYTTEPTEYIADNRNVKANATVDDILKKMDGMEVNTDGSIAFQGQAVAGAKLNGKDFSGGNLSNAIQNLPADIVENLQIVDTLNKKDLIAANRPAPQLREVSIYAPVTNDRTVSGKVLDKQGAPLIGATVVVEGTGKGVATDMNGDFKIELPANKDLLAVNYVGFNPQQVKVGDQSDLKIALDANESNLNEVVVVAYGVQKKTRAKSTACKENPRFKSRFFEHIATVEKYTEEQLNTAKQTVKPAAFKKALAFLIKYTKVPVTVPGDAGYKNLQTFKADKDQWLKWYEDNKCSNLK
jgi:hypothetical protein